MRSFYARGNILIRYFGKCSTAVKVQLFKTFCSNIYAGHLWHNYTKEVLRRCNVAYNNIFRSLFNVKRGDSISTVFVTNNVRSFKELCRNYVNNFHKRLQNSPNVLVNTVLGLNNIYLYTICQQYSNYAKAFCVCACLQSAARRESGHNNNSTFKLIYTSRTKWVEEIIHN